jgi:signal transduction histidine kinase/CheY-like chemotaxis protein
MISAPQPENEPRRLAALHRYSILDTLPEQVYDDVVHLAAQICDTPIALISFVDADRQWFKARFGLDAAETPREVAFCAHAILGTDVCAVENATLDERFHDNPLVAGGPGIRFYAGAPMFAPDGSALGTVCVIDQKPRTLSQAQLEALEALSRQVVTHLELRLQAAMQEQLVNALLETRERYDLAVRANRDGIWDCDFARRTSYCTPRALEILDLEPEAVEPTIFEWRERVHPEDAAMVQAAHEHGNSFDAEFRWQLRDGAYRWIHVRSTAIRLSNGSVARMAGSVANVTRRRQAADELREAKEAAEQASHAKGNFLATMSHEIRTPMNAVLGYVSLLRETDLTEQQRDYLGVIESSGQTLLSLINDVLDYAKIEAGRVDLEQIAFEPRTVVSNITKMLRPRADAKGIQLIENVAADVPLVLSGDPTRLGQILLNLCGNAVKFTNTGSVRITVQPEGADQLRIEVKDSGIGIATDRVGKLFQEFSQADSSTTRRFGGTGLGLAISRRLVLLMGGSIGVDSEAGEGATFWLVVPLQPATPEMLAAMQPPSQQRAEQEPTTAMSTRKRVLLVEDNPVNQHLAKQFLRSLQCDVTVAANGVEAIEQITDSVFDVVLMDCVMPEMDGYQATREIRRRETGSERHLPIIALTANAMASDQKACREAGMDDYLSKPFRKAELQQMLQRWASPTGDRAQA